MVGFAQPSYTVQEGSSVLVCVEITALTGQLPDDSFALVGFNTARGPISFRDSGQANFAGRAVSDTVFCSQLNITEDNIIENEQLALISMFVEGPPFITLTPNRDTTEIVIIDNDSKLASAV